MLVEGKTRSASCWRKILTRDNSWIGGWQVEVHSSSTSKRVVYQVRYEVQNMEYDEDTPVFEKFRSRHKMGRKDQWNMCLKKKSYDESTVGAIKRKIKNDRGVELRFYKCPLCKHYHLTKGNGHPALGE
jgi:hypothetical protein